MTVTVRDRARIEAIDRAVVAGAWGLCIGVGFYTGALVVGGLAAFLAGELAGLAGFLSGLLS